MKKRVWSKPALVVLVRGKPEEAILTFCKYETMPEVSGQPYFANCNHSLAALAVDVCSNCFANLPS